MTAFARRSGPLARFPLILVTLAGLSSPAQAQGLGTPLPAAGERMVNHLASGIAVGGFDPVAFFDQSRAVPGRAEHEWQYDGAVFRFATQANKEAFAESPETFIPLFGGHDALAVTEGRAVAGSPAHFLVTDSGLMLFHSAETRNGFAANPELIASALARWPRVRDQLAR